MKPTSPELTNIRAIVGLERDSREGRSILERFALTVSDLAGSPAFLVLHCVWFAVWIGMNVRGSSFDPYPFNLLTLVVSLEAIVLTGFVLMTQNQMTQQADKRAHLDLQINLLAEQELTAILKLQCLLAAHAGIDVGTVDARLEQLLEQTDVRRLSLALDKELESAAREAGIPKRADEVTADRTSAGTPEDAPVVPASTQA